MKARIAAVAVIGLLTLSVIAVGVSALGETGDAAAADPVVAGRDDGENAAVATFRFVCPFH